MRNKSILFIIIFLSVIALNGERYRLTYWFSGNGSSKVLLFFSFRFYYEAGGSIDFLAEKNQNSLEFNFFCLPEVNYLKRTLNFSGSSLAAVAIPADGKVLDKAFFDQQFEDQYYLSLKSASNVKRKIAGSYSYRLKRPDRKAFSFKRLVNGSVSTIENNLLKFVLISEPKLMITFDPFLMVETLLRFYFPLFSEKNQTEDLLFRKQSWKIADLNLSSNLNQLAAAIEEIVKKYVQVNQKGPILMEFKATGPDNDLKMKICGRSEREVFFWKNFRITQLKREVEINLKNGCLLDIDCDRISMEIGDNGTNQGFGFIEIKRFKE